MIDIANKYIKRISEKVTLEGQEKLLKMIKSTNDLEQQNDYLIPLFLALILSDISEKLILEEKWDFKSNRCHDLVAYLSNGTRIVNEIKRLRQTQWDKEEFNNHVLNSVARTGQLYELKEDPNHSTTGFLDTILNEVELKEKQLEPKVTNIIWFSSRGIHYQATFIEDAASHYAQGWNNLPTEQPGKAHKKPKFLSALGWLWDGEPENTTAKPQCFFITPCKDVEILKNVIQIKNM